MANTNRSTSPDPLFVPEDAHYNNGHPSQRAQPNRPALPPRAPRFAGDGYDFRSPVMSEGGGSNTATGRNPAMVIDLTEEDDSQDANAPAPSESAATATAGSSRAQRLPRYGRNIIDMTSDAEEEHTAATSSRPNITDFLPPPGHRNPRDHHPRISLLRRPPRHNTDTPNMDDLEFVESRPRSRPQTTSRSHTPAAPTQRSVTPYPTGIHDTIDLTEDDDDVVHVDTRTRPQGVNLASPGATGGVGTRSTADRAFDFTGVLQTGSRLLQRLSNFGGALDGMAREPPFLEQAHVAGANSHRHQHNHQQHLRFAQQPPPRFGGVVPLMDYDMTGFDMGFGGNQPPTPKYEPPEPPAEGFTRNPGEDEVVVCPNCGDELAIGETEKKQEVWVIKKCGHVYCGDCAENRHKSSSKGVKKGKGKAAVIDAPAPFKQCVVDGCNESASSKSMVRVFFGG
ncbi:hypothetical protein M409DRAFT_28360 [Zasmidium cellare ATCC 36951]|uniref:RING-type domain-containing protein n=1 Tax=Zasmidium cellare ATCC 36951 TaxID=1080233 RepID=A0A6A6C312_ZASCE|nr:uncharacterized protein M409DRAFT_28360 [Zasmidium cellare ATCC 36951]KAF2161323.1 hypothetical protein M409DRAFT_28360 [Zasmidium cellare ATCC 36951]